MTLKEQARLERLMPSGAPRWVRCYDNGGVGVAGGSIDRYCAVFCKRSITTERPSAYMYLGMSAAPYHPQGFGQHGEHRCPVDTVGGVWPPAIGRKGRLGRRIRFEDLPADCQRFVATEYRELWDLAAPVAEVKPELTLGDHAEAWWREQGREVPPADSKAWTSMYEQWVNYAFEKELL